MLTTVIQLPQRVAGLQDAAQKQMSRLTFRQWLNTDWGHFTKSVILIPVFPVLGYYGMDQTGVSAFMVQQGWMPHQVLGEGFGHVGLCFSLHYVVNAGRFLYKACRSAVAAPTR